MHSLQRIWADRSIALCPLRAPGSANCQLDAGCLVVLVASCTLHLPFDRSTAGCVIRVVEWRSVQVDTLQETAINNLEIISAAITAGR